MTTPGRCLTSLSAMSGVPLYVNYREVMPSLCTESLNSTGCSGGNTRFLDVSVRQESFILRWWGGAIPDKRASSRER